MFSSTRNALLRKFIPLRYFHTTQIQRIDPKTVEEIKIPVPWGHIAGKWWGCKQIEPIIALHGFLDNAGSFDTLLPLLKTKSILCLDLPGHGQTSHFPKGVSIHFPEYVLNLRYIINRHFKWDKISLLCHSFGSSVGFMYASIYPETVKQMVNIDCGRLWTAGSTDRTLTEFRSSTEGFSQDFDTDPDARGFTWDETISRLVEARKKEGLPLSRNSCEVIAKRGTVKIGENQYRFSHDKRLKFSSFSRFTKKLASELAERISCEVLNMEATNGIIRQLPNPKDWKENLEKLGKRSKLITVTVNGGHHVHLETPDIVAPVLNDFLEP